MQQVDLANLSLETKMLLQLKNNDIETIHTCIHIKCTSVHHANKQS